MWDDETECLSLDNEEYLEEDAREDLFMDSLESYYYQNTNGERDWHDLTFSEVRTWRDHYEEHLRLEESYANPETFYMTGGTR